MTSGGLHIWMIQTNMIRKFYDEIGLYRLVRPVRLQRPEANEVNETVEVLRHGKSLLRTSDSSRFLNSALF